MQNILITENKISKLYKINSFEQAKKHFPNEHFTSSKRKLRLFLDIEALSDKILEDFTKHLLLYQENNVDYFIVINIGDKVDETNITDKTVMKNAMQLMKNYSVSDSFLDFIKNNKDLTENDKISHIKKFIPEHFLDFIIENDLDVSEYNWLPRNAIKKTLLSDPKYLNYLIKKDSKTKSNKTSIFIIDYILSGSMSNKTKNLLKSLFTDENNLNSFQSVIDSILLKGDYTFSLTKSILKNIFTLEEEGIIKFNSFGIDFFDSTLGSLFKDEELSLYRDKLISKKIKFVFITNKKIGKWDYFKEFNLFFTDYFKYFTSFLSESELDDLINIWRNKISENLFSFFFEERKNYSTYKDIPFCDNALNTMLNDPFRSKFIFLSDYSEIIIKKTRESYNSSSLDQEYNIFISVLLKVDFDLIKDCFSNPENKAEIINIYTKNIFYYTKKETFNLEYKKRLNNVINLDKSNIDHVNNIYLFNKKYEDLDNEFDFNYNSIKIQNIFKEKIKKLKEHKIDDFSYKSINKEIRELTLNKNFKRKFDKKLWDKEIVDYLAPFLNFNINFDLSTLKSLFLEGSVEELESYLNKNKEEIRHSLRLNKEDTFIKKLSLIFFSLN